MAGEDGGKVRMRDILRLDVPKLHAAAMSDRLNASPVARFVIETLDSPARSYMMQVMYCVPAALLWRSRPDDGSPSSFIHKFYLRALWNERKTVGRLGLLAQFLLWPPIVLGMLAPCTWINGRGIRKRTGKSVFRQLREQLALAVRHGILPPWYYMFELYDPERFARAGEYLRRDETKGGLYRILKKPGAARRLEVKSRFADRLTERGVRTPEYLTASKGEVRGADGRTVRSLPKTDLFAKPNSGRGGCGVEQWRYDGSGWSRDGAPPIGEAELLDHFGELAKIPMPPKNDGYLVQKHLVPHPSLADVSGSVLTTVRMVTIRNESGGYEATHAAFRMPIRPGAKVDNFHAGGLAAKIDMQTGELSAASDIGLHPSSTWHAKHPCWGGQIEGRKLPFWGEAVELALRAHAAIPHWAVIGWDIAIVEDGPVMIEGNSGADLDIIQRSHREPIGDSRFGQLLAHHLRVLGHYLESAERGD